MLALFARIQTLFTTAYDRATGEDEGATAVEYGLLVGLIAVAIIATLMLIGPQLTTLFNHVVTGLTSANAAA